MEIKSRKRKKVHEKIHSNVTESIKPQRIEISPQKLKQVKTKNFQVMIDHVHFDDTYSKNKFSTVDTIERSNEELNDNSVIENKTYYFENMMPSQPFYQ